MNKIIIAFTALICFSAISCHFNSTYENRDIDKEDGEKIVAQFYESLQSNDYKKTYIFFDKQFFEVTDTQKLNHIYDISFGKLGKIESYNIEEWQTTAIVGTDSKTNYRFVCNVKRSNFMSKETLIFLKESKGIKIISYHVNSEGFFEK